MGAGGRRFLGKASVIRLLCLLASVQRYGPLAQAQELLQWGREESGRMLVLLIAGDR